MTTTEITVEAGTKRTPGSFRERYEAAAVKNDSLLCVGLDPDPSRIPIGVSVKDFLVGVIETTSDLVCAYKPNSAFFEQYGDRTAVVNGMEVRSVTHERCRELVFTGYGDGATDDGRGR